MAKKTAKPTVWIARESCEAGGWYYICNNEVNAIRAAEDDWQIDSALYSLCPAKFEKFTGYKLNYSEYSEISIDIKDV